MANDYIRKDLTQHPFFRSPLLKNRLLNHILFWLGYILFFSLLSFSTGEPFLIQLQSHLIVLPIKMLGVYTTLYVLIPRFFLKNRYWTFTVCLVALLLIAGFIQRAIVFYVIYPLKYPLDLQTDLTDFWITYWIVIGILEIAYVTLFASIIKITKFWYQDHQRAKSLMQEKLEAELKFLKAQIHPHFLFNTLNNLYSLTLQKSDYAPEVVLRLSGLVNYMLYDASAPIVPLSREIECIHNYITLEKIRYGSSLEIHFDVSGNISGAQIAPMLLLPFIENSFKHGVSDKIEHKWIIANLNVNNEFLTFKVENAKPSLPIARDKPDYTGGIGLENVRRRLELLYPGKYDLKIMDENDSYLVNLRIILQKP